MESVKVEINEELNMSSPNGIYGEPVILPCIGEDYQADIPDVMICNARNYQERMALDVPIFMWDPPSSEVQCIPLPGIRASTWTESEKEMFLVGIYLFGKRLNLVRRFLEGRKTGDLLCYYYGKFYKSDAHRRFKTKRHVVGTGIFTGWRQQEVLSRLMDLVPTGFHGQLQEILKRYDQGESLFEDFIFTLKCATGPHFLMQAIGIGKGKRDLTRIRSKPTSSRYQTHTSLEMPLGKRWSALSSEEIMQLLTGRFRLNKARTNGIFWEAVWPRLLIKGWTSHKPTDHTSIFLVPGIENFTGEGLIVGIHYFTSVIDLLYKVVSNPELILLDKEDPLNSNENGDKNISHDHLYLDPNLSGLNLDPIKFTITDTSIIQEEGSFKRAVRCLPLDDATHGVNALSNHPSKSETDRSAVEAARSQPMLKDCLAPLPKPRQLTACKKETKRCKMEQPKDHENDENCSLQSNGGDTDRKICSQEMLKKEKFTTGVDGNIENQELCGTNGRRHSTRNRPPTAKALESLALGLLGRKRRRRNSEKKSLVCQYF